jgi:hypothetical protein
MRCVTPKTLRYFAIIRVVIWSAQIPLIFIFPELLKSIQYLVSISILAGWEGAFSAWQAGRAEEVATPGDDDG